MNLNPADFLDPCDVIDFQSPNVDKLARELADDDETATARKCFEFVRDQIRHSCDHQLNPVTLQASDVLEHGTGYCYAKSHLLCALLRANRIPAGLCYQRLRIDETSTAFCLHGLCGVYLSEFGWYRIDPRGNRDDLDARFDPPTERLAFATSDPGESDLPGIHIQPLPEVVDCLQNCQTWQAVADNLPDLGA